MDKEKEYAELVGAKHLKELGQFFTGGREADFMCEWACRNAETMLDPAVGNSVFFKYARKHNPSCSLTGYETDSGMLDFFGNPCSAEIFSEDYILGDWENKYDAIVCNPPYNRFQAVKNRDELFDCVYRHTGIRYSGYTNLYVLFLAKSIYQLSEKGRLAYIIPSEFMNSRYGTEIKRLMTENRLLRAVLSFENDSDMFFNATTTCCILLIDREPKEYVSFYVLDSADGLNSDILSGAPTARVVYDKLSAMQKWRTYLKRESSISYKNLLPVSHFCTVSRGIATGDNDFFCFSSEKAVKFGIPESCLSKCICRSADVKRLFFGEADHAELSAAGKKVYLLDVTEEYGSRVSSYLDMGIADGTDKKYLPSHRSPWFMIEKKKAAPIWVSTAFREDIKFVRNTAGIKNLTTFHSVYVNDEYAEKTDLIFCYFLTAAAQEIIIQNCKEMGNGLHKLQPNDLNEAKMLDIDLISADDTARITEIYNKMMSGDTHGYIDELNSIFCAYLR